MPVRARVLRAGEFLLLFVVLPVLVAWDANEARRWIIPQILGFAAIFCAMLWRDPGFDRAALRHLPRARLRGVFLVWIAGGLAFLAFTAWLLPDRIFSFPRLRPGFWMIVLVFYPLLSALPQELIFRVFLFHRYRDVFRSDVCLIAASAGAFALAHLQLGNAIAVGISLLGGVRLAMTYARSRSLPLVAIEHGLWGDWIFTIGLGTYFYGGHF